MVGEEKLVTGNESVVFLPFFLNKRERKRGKKRGNRDNIVEFLGGIHRLNLSGVLQC